jgi:hypothetical protein
MGIIISLFVFLSNASVCDTKPVDTIKQDIITLAKTNTSNETNRPEIRILLEELKFQLACKSKTVDPATWLQYSPGSWRQIWSDEADNSPAGSPQRDLEKIFQIVIAQGRAVNFGVRIMPDGSRVTFALEAKGTVVDNIQTTEIVDAFVRNQDLVSGESLQLLADDIFNKSFSIFTPVVLGTFPKGPIGAKSDLTLSYIDENLKIGTAPNVYTGMSEMFVLERVAFVP